jgi:hypothetical protein
MSQERNEIKMGKTTERKEMNYSIMPDGRLKLTVTKEEQEALRERRADAQENKTGEWWGSSAIESEVLEPLIANSELQWILEGSTADLTSAPMLGILEEAPSLMDSEPPRSFGEVDGMLITHRWAWMDYQVRSFLDDLADKGECVWEGGAA